MIDGTFVTDEPPSVEELLAGLGKLPPVEHPRRRENLRPALLVGLGLGLMVTLAFGVVLRSLSLAP